MAYLLSIKNSRCIQDIPYHPWQLGNVIFPVLIWQLLAYLFFKWHNYCQSHAFNTVRKEIQKTLKSLLKNSSLHKDIFTLHSFQHLTVHQKSQQANTQNLVSQKKKQQMPKFTDYSGMLFLLHFIEVISFYQWVFHDRSYMQSFATSAVYSNLNLKSGYRSKNSPHS